MLCDALYLPLIITDSSNFHFWNKLKSLIKVEGYIPVTRKRKFKTSQFHNSQNFKTADTKTIQEIKDFVKYAKKLYF